MNLAQTSSQTAHVETLVSTCVTAEAYKFGQLGLPVGSALAMEYQSRKFVLRKCLCIWLTPIALPYGCAVLANGLITSPVYRLNRFRLSSGEFSSLRAGPAHLVHFIKDKLHEITRKVIIPGAFHTREVTVFAPVEQIQRNAERLYRSVPRNLINNQIRSSCPMFERTI